MSFSFFASAHGALHLCGHRGHSLGAPENTLAAFAACAEAGGTTCEIDTVLTKDKEIVVIHDLTLDRTTNGTGPVKDRTRAEVQALDAGAWFAPAFAGTRIPTLREVLEATRASGMGFEVEIKEELDLDSYAGALRDTLTDPADFERVMMISFDHASLRDLKAKIPGLKTGGIAHERYGDPLAIARSADLDQLCIDLSVYRIADAEKLHAAGLSIRCHAYRPEVFARGLAAGLPWDRTLADALRNGLIDTLSGDDVAWLRSFRDVVLMAEPDKKAL